MPRVLYHDIEIRIEYGNKVGNIPAGCFLLRFEEKNRVA